MARLRQSDMEEMHDTVLSRSNSSVSSQEEDDFDAKRPKTDDEEDVEVKEVSDRDSISPKRKHYDDDSRSEDDEDDEGAKGSDGRKKGKVAKKDTDDEDVVSADDDDAASDKESASSRKEDVDKTSPSPKEKEENVTAAATVAAAAEGEIKEPPPIIMHYCAYQGSRSVDEYECLNKIEEGAYGVVYRAKDKKSGEIVALKRLKMEKEKEGFPITSLREVDILLKMQHPNIVTVREIVVGSNMDKIYMVMDYVEHDLKSLMQHGMKKPFMTGEVKTLMFQLLNGIAHLHDNWIIHRDLKTSNLLLSHKGILKIADFGLAREYGSPLKEYTPVVVTLWYRSPELLLNTKKYSTAIDMWSVGCIFGELMLMKPLFNGKNEKDQLDKIFKDLGTPNDRVWPDFKNLPLANSLNFPNFPYNTLRNRFGSYLSNKGFELINKLLTYDPQRRITAEEALKSEYFKETPLPVDPSMFPTWPAKSEGLSKPKLEKDSEPRAPSAGKMYEQMVADEGFVLRIPVFSGFNPK